MRYIYLVAYVVSIFVANLLIDKFIELPFYGMLSAGTIFFAFVFTLRDHLHRYGMKFALIGITIALIVNTSLSLLLAIPIRFIIASFLAILFSELADTAVFERLKERSWALKVIASNAVSVPVDSIVMTLIAFLGVMTGEEMLAIIFADILAKYCIALTVIIRPEKVRSLWLKRWHKPCKEKQNVYP
ncbi:VUT family protein [Ignatzschineria rhizosphaerae]|uniref:VUT family protein n=1 Tax=Ignatzschineria rhizosphaerae TaxID=2923279 RepID=A0ABY3WWS9_9GAMM|nr:VUT family protein [Ignatzschineria rhizosphaerae]UNM95054.1 VUT family protein [Ignatzschineria rhizosphaerae]